MHFLCWAPLNDLSRDLLANACCFLFEDNLTSTPAAAILLFAFKLN